MKRRFDVRSAILLTGVGWLACSGRDASRDAAMDQQSQADGGPEQMADTGGGDVPADKATDAGGDPAADAPAPDTAPETGACALGDTYMYWLDGGFKTYEDRTKLSPPRMCQITREKFGGAPPATCMDDIPACGTDAAVDVGEVTAALAHPDVVAALAMTSGLLYGRDTRPMDGTVFMLKRASDAHELQVGAPCSSDQACVDVPAGVSALVAVLDTLRSEALARPACAVLGP